MAELIPILPVEGEALPLPDGRRATFRAITPAAKAVIARALRRMSPESIRRRFFSPRRELSDIELERLTAMDGWNRYAIGLCTVGADGAIEGIGDARFVRLDEEPRTAEIALTVVDAYQGKGFGKALLARLVAAATIRGVERLQAFVLPDNEPILALFAKYLPQARWRHTGDHYTADIPLRVAPVRLAA
jgi:RimJ/RimL family protein N-acetyltransferase